VSFIYDESNVHSPRESLRLVLKDALAANEVRNAN
jgi:hypothetical protein